jgi:hypothetical protein
MVSQHARIDFAARDRQGRVVLLAEAMSRPGTTGEWAAHLRTNMLAHGDLPPSRYFLVATPEHMYFWSQEDPGPEQGPDFTLDTPEVLERYLRSLKLEPSGIAPEAFKLLILTWLTVISQFVDRGLRPGPSSQWLAELTASLQQTSIETDSVQ